MNKLINQNLRILFAEDNIKDHHVVVDTLKAGLAFESLRVDKMADFVQSLTDFHPDLVLLDYTLVDFNGLEAIRKAKSITPETPLIVFTGSRSEDIALQCIKAGAAHYLLKSELKLLPVVIANTLAVCRSLKEKQALEELLSNTENKFSQYVQHAPEGICIVNKEGRYIEVNQAALDMTGYSREELLSMYLFELLTPVSAPDGMAHFKRLQTEGEAYSELEINIKGGKVVWWAVKAVALPDGTFMAFISDVSERIKAEQEKAKSEKRYHDLINTMEQGLALHEIITDDNGKAVDYRFLEVNDSFTKITGLTRDALIGKTVIEVLPDTEQFWIDIYAEVAKSGVSREFENYSAQLGRTFRVNVYSPERGSFATIVEDVTERIAVHQQLKDSEQKFRMIAENSADVIFSMDLNLNTHYISPSVTKLNGYTVEESMTLPFMFFVAEKDRSKLQLLITEELEKEAVAEGDPERAVNIEYSLVHKDGHIVDVEARVRFLRDESGKAIGFTGLARDVTERKKLELELSVSNNRFRQVIEESQSVVWECDTQGLITYISPLSNIMLGYTPEEIVKLKHVYDFAAADQIESFKEVCLTAFKQQKQYKDFIHPVLHKDGQLVYVSSNGNPVLDEAGQLTGYRGVDQDVTRRVMANKELQQSRNNFNALMEAVTETLFLIDMEGNILAANSETARRLDMSHDECLRLNAYNFFPDEVKPEIRQYLSEIERTKQMVAFEDLRYGRWIMNHVFPVIQKDKVEGFAVFGMDITEKKLAEEENLELTHTLKAVTTAAYDGIIMMDDMGKVVFWNQAAEKIFGYSGDEIIGRNLHQLLAPGEYHSAHDNAFASFVRSGKGNAIGKTLELRGIQKSGAVIPIELSLSAIRLKERWMAVGIVRDISERIKAASLVEEGMKLKNLLFNVSNDGIVWIDRTHKVFDANERFCQMLGYEKDEITQLSTWDYDNNMKKTDVVENFGEVSAINRVFDTAHRRKDGSLYDVEVSANGFKLDDQAYVVCVCRDISERKRYERELQQKIDELEKFNRFTIGRELKMIELKAEINKLLQNNGLPARYDLKEML